MKGVQIRQLRRLTAVRVFADAHLADDRTFDALRARLDATAARIRALTDVQSSASGIVPHDASEIRTLRRALRERLMIPIAAAGRELLAFAPGAERALQVPKKHASLATLLAAAERMRRLVSQHLRLFVGVGFRKGIAADLRKAATALRARAALTGTGRKKLAAATTELARAFERAQADINILGARLAERMAASPALATEWRTARRVSARMGRKRKPRVGPPLRPGGQGLGTRSSV